jgi:hypothetical protein
MARPSGACRIEVTMSSWQSTAVSVHSQESSRNPAGILSMLDPPRMVLAIILIGTIIRLVFSASVGLGSDESYTVANARTLALSYVDYPPLHAWLVGAWSWLWGSESPLIVRLPFIALFAGSTWMMFRLTALLFGARAGAWAALLLNLSPVFTLPHASWVLPDGPLIFFMLSGAFAVARLLFENERPSSAMAGWIWAGTLAGFAILSKYHGIFLLAGVFVFLVSWPPGRRVLAAPGPWLGATAALVVFVPVLIWNANHDWVGLFFQTQRLKHAPLEFGRVFTSLGAQAGYLAPWIFVPLAYVWVASLVRGPSQPQRWFLAMLASGPIIGFTLANIMAPGLPHWSMPGWLFVFPILGAEAARVAKAHPKLMSSAVVAAAAALMAVIVLFGTNARTGWLVNDLPARYLHADPTTDLLDWNELDAVLARRHVLNAQTPAIAATHWNEAGKLNYSMGRDVPVLCLCADPQQFRYLQTLARFSGRNIIIVGMHRDAAEIEGTLMGRFARFEILKPVILHRAGRAAIELTILRGIGFKPGAER